MMKQNNIYRVILSIAKNLNTITLLSAAVWAITSCTDEELAQVSVGKAGQLHIASVNVGDNKVASRAEGESGETTTVTPGYNEVVTDVSSLTLNYSFVQNNTSLDKTAIATKNGSNTWSVTAGEGNALQPSGENEKWEHLRIEATNMTGEGCATEMPTDIASLNNDESMRIYQDKLFASNDTEEGGITVTTQLGSAQLGEMSITLKHVHALLHLQKPLPTTTTADDASGQSSPYTVEGGTYVKNGVAYQIVEENPLLTLWAELEKETETIYVPLTLNATDNVLQAIAPADYTLKAFKAVLDVEGDDNDHFVLDLPISVASGQLLTANTQYNLTLTITPRVQEVVLERTDKPGWGNENVTLQGSNGQSLKYENSKFVVSSAQGLQELNQWMTETGGENVKYIEGYGDIDQKVSRLSHDIHIDGKINLSNDNLIYDLNGDDTNESNWKPLGTNETPYTGKITADENAEITGLEIHVNTNNGGFVGYLGEEGKIDGLKLQGNFSTTSANNFGAVAGYNNGGTISGCVVGVQSASEGNQTTVTGTINDGKNYSYIGGVVGWNNTGLITKCTNYATVEAPGYKMVGGVLGENYRLDNCVITECQNYGNVKGLENVGGVVGINHRVVKDCHNNKNISVIGKTNVGGVVGQSNDANPYYINQNPGWPIYVINCTNQGSVTGETCFGGVVGTNGSGNTCGGYIVASWNSGSLKYEMYSSNDDVSAQADAEIYVGGIVGNNNFGENKNDGEELSSNPVATLGNRTSQIIACYNIGSIDASGATTPKVGGVVGQNENGSRVWASYWSVSNITNGCGDEQNTGTDEGKDYAHVTDWGSAITAMNFAIKKYLQGVKENAGNGGYGIVEGPSNSEFAGITTAVKEYVAGTDAPQLSETAAGN